MIFYVENFTRSNSKWASSILVVYLAYVDCRCDKTADVIITDRLACGKNLTQTIMRCVRFTVFTCCQDVIKCSSPGGFCYGNCYLCIIYNKIWFYTRSRSVIYLFYRVLLFLINSVFFLFISSSEQLF